MPASTTSLQSVPQSMTVSSLTTPVTEPPPAGLAAAVSVHCRMKFAVTVLLIGVVHCCASSVAKGEQPLQEPNRKPGAAVAVNWTSVLSLSSLSQSVRPP